MFRLVVAAIALVALAACRISLEDADVGDGLFPRCDETVVSAVCTAADSRSDLAWIQENVFRPNCSSSICHSATSTDLHLVSGMSFQELVNVPSTVYPDRTLVVPGDVNASYLMFVLGHYEAAQSNPPGAELPPEGYMPLNSGELCCQKLNAIERWIAAGAQNN
jgi:hypothetical protein